MEYSLENLYKQKEYLESAPTHNVIPETIQEKVARLDKLNTINNIIQNMLKSDSSDFENEEVEEYDSAFDVLDNEPLKGEAATLRSGFEEEEDDDDEYGDDWLLDEDDNINNYNCQSKIQSLNSAENKLMEERFSLDNVKDTDEFNLDSVKSKFDKTDEYISFEEFDRIIEEENKQKLESNIIDRFIESDNLELPEEISTGSFIPTDVIKDTHKKDLRFSDISNIPEIREIKQNTEFVFDEDDDIDVDPDYNYIGDKIVFKIPNEYFGTYASPLSSMSTKIFRTSTEPPRTFINSTFGTKNYLETNQERFNTEEYRYTSYYRLLCINLFVGCYKFARRYGQVKFNMDYSNIPEFIDVNQIHQMLVYKLRQKGLKVITFRNYGLAIDTLAFGDKSTDILNNVASDIFGARDVSDFVTINFEVERCTRKIDFSKLLEFCDEDMRGLNHIKLFIMKITNIGTTINSSDFDMNDLSRLKQLYYALVLELESILDFSMIDYNNLNSSNNYIITILELYSDTKFNISSFYSRIECINNVYVNSVRFTNINMFDKIDTLNKLESLVIDLYNCIIENYFYFNFLSIFIEPNYYKYEYWR